MNKLLRQIAVLARSLYGFCLKGLYDMHLLSVPSLGQRESIDAVVSLTSYGRRVSTGIVCYTLYSLLRQTRHPKRILLCIDQTAWNTGNLPKRLQALQRKGIEVRFSQDIYSYTKLLPAISLCPNEVIITVDDDVLYPKRLLEELWRVHEVHPNDIVATHVLAPTDPTLPYRQWAQAPSGTESLHYFPLGVGGVLYPPRSLKKEMLNYDLAKQYAPKADDVWFWAAGIAAGTLKRKTGWTFQSVSFDAIYQYLHQGSALQHSNVKGETITNNTQIEATLAYLQTEWKVSVS